MMLPKFDANMIKELQQIIKKKFAGLDRKEIKKMFRISVAQQMQSCKKSLDEKDLSESGQKIIRGYMNDLQKLNDFLDESETPGFRNTWKRKKAMAEFVLHLLVMDRKYHIRNVEKSNTVDAATADFEKETV